MVFLADDLDSYLQSLPDTIKNELTGAIKAQADRLSAAQREALQALQSPPEESGNLEASCRVVPGDNDLTWVVEAGGDLTTTEVRTGSGEDFDYGEAFEYGTTHQHAKPFFWPTYRALRPDMQREINEAIDKAFK